MSEDPASLASKGRARRPTAGEPFVAEVSFQAEALFTNRSELTGWLACAFQRHTLRAPQHTAPCSDIAAAACAVTFGCVCSETIRPGRFVELVEGLSTPRLEALLSLRRSRR